MSQQLGHRADRFLETLLQPIINLVSEVEEDLFLTGEHRRFLFFFFSSSQIPNSARVMATSGIVCMRFVIQNTYSARFLPVICSNVTSKSREIRRHCCEFLDQLLHTWPTHTLRKHVATLQEAIKKGIADADPDARQFSRK